MKILYADRGIVACIKPVGLDSETEVPAALKKELGGEIFPIHRLDKNVGGIMIFARTKAAAAALSKAVQDGQMVKEYVAMVHGTPPESGDWEDFLFKDSRKNKVFAVKKERKGEICPSGIQPVKRRRTKSGAYPPAHRSQSSDSSPVLQPWFPPGG